MVDQKTAEPSSPDWGWRGHQCAQRRRLARLPLAEKLAWLEEAQRVVSHLQSQRIKAGSKPTRSG
jgi:hypothetical protein